MKMWMQLALVLCVGCAAPAAVEDAPEERSSSDADAAAAPAIELGNGQANWIRTDGAQRTGAVFTFSEVHIDGNGWLVMHPFENGKPNGDIYVGASYISSGTNTDVSIEVDGQPASGDQFIVMLHRDVDEDRHFDFVFVGDTGQVEDQAVFEGNTMIAHVFSAP